MKYIYIKYEADYMNTVIKDNTGIRYSCTEISHKTKSEKKYSDNSKLFQNTSYDKLDKEARNIDSSKVIDIKSHLQNEENTINEEITQFFFDSVHKNYLKNRKL